MADKKISELVECDPLDGTEDLPIVQDGVTVRCSTQEIADLAIGYNSYVALLTNDSGTVTPTILSNSTGATIAWTNPSNGVVQATASGSVFTNAKTWIMVPSLSGGGVAYHVTWERFSGTIVQFAIIKHDGTQTGTPNFTDLPVEIRIYP